MSKNFPLFWLHFLKMQKKKIIFVSQVHGVWRTKRKTRYKGALKKSKKALQEKQTSTGIVQTFLWVCITVAKT